MSDEKKTIFGHAAPQNLSIPTASHGAAPAAGSSEALPTVVADTAPTVQDAGPFQSGAPAVAGQQPGDSQAMHNPPPQGHYGGPGGPPPQGQYGGPPPQGPYGGPGGPPPQGQYGGPPPQGPYGGAPPQGQYGGPGGAPPQGPYGGPPPQGPYGGPPPQGQYGGPPPQGQYGGAPPQGQYGGAPAGQVPQVKPVKTGLYVASFFISFLGFAMIGVGVTDPKLTELVPFAGLPVLVSVIFQWVLLYKSWAAIQDGHARTTPGAAIGLLFIPIFSIYWIFIAYGSWGRNFNAFSRRHGIGFEVSEKLFTFHCFMMFFGGPIAIVTGIMMCLAMCRGINAVANRQYGGLPVARVAG